MVEAYRTKAVVTGLRAARANVVGRKRGDWRAACVNWDLKTVAAKFDRVTEALAPDVARRIERAAVVR